jgi:hypothetical protein
MTELGSMCRLIKVKTNEYLQIDHSYLRGRWRFIRNSSISEDLVLYKTGGNE